MNTNLTKTSGTFISE